VWLLGVGENGVTMRRSTADVVILLDDFRTVERK